MKHCEHPSCTSASVWDLWPPRGFFRRPRWWSLGAKTPNNLTDVSLLAPIRLGVSYTFTIQPWLPSDFHLSDPLKKHLVCHRFNCESARTYLSVVLSQSPKFYGDHWQTFWNMIFGVVFHFLIRNVILKISFSISKYSLFFGKIYYTDSI